MKTTHAFALLSVCLSVFLSCGNPRSLKIQDDEAESFIVSHHLSNLNVNVFCEDKYGHIWIGTDRGLNRATGKEFYQYFNDISEKTINNNLVNDIFLDSSGRLWVATSSGAAYYTDKDDFHRVPVEARIGRKQSYQIIELEDGAIVSRNILNELFCFDSQTDMFLPVKDENGEIVNVGRMMKGKGNGLWTFGESRLRHIEIGTETTIVNYPCPYDNIYISAVQDDYGTIWIYGNDNILCFNTNYNQYGTPPGKLQSLIEGKKQKLERIYVFDLLMVLQFSDECWFYHLDKDVLINQHDESAVYNLPEIKPTIMFMDSNNNLYIGADGYGFDVCSRQKKVFNRNETLFKTLQGINVVSMDRDRMDRIWLTTNENKLLSSDVNGDFHEYDPNRLRSAVHEMNNDVLEFQLIKVDRSSDRLWVKSDNRLICYDIDDHDLTYKESYSFIGNIRTFEIIEGEVIYVGMNNGKFASVDVARHSVSYKNIGLSGYIYDICPLKNGELLISSYKEPLTRYNPGDDRYSVIDYRKQTGEMFHIIDKYEDVDGIIWLITRDYGLIRYDVVSDRFERIKGTTCNTLTDIRGTDDNKIWISSAHGLNLLDPDDGSIIHFYDEMGSGGNQFNDKCSCILSDGTILFGGTHGVTACHGIDEEFESHVIPLCFESIKVNGKYILPDSDTEYDRHITGIPCLHLRHDENNISLSFAALEYFKPHMIHYEYILDGYDQFPISIGALNTAHYSSLPPGKYNLKISCKSPFNEVSFAELPIIIKPPFYGTGVAYLIYFVISIIVIVFIYRNFKRRIILNMQLEQSISEKEHERYINRMNMNFFADMAHEFRSPLTMIVGPLMQIKDDKSLNIESLRLVNLMKLSVDRMNKLVNQLLDFNKMDNGQLTLKMIRGYNVTLLLSQILDMFTINARRLGIRVETYGLDKEYRVPLDPDKFESIISNLLSNALKYAGNNGESGVVSVCLESDMSCLRVKIENNGQPFEEEELEKLFDRYYQIRQHAYNCKQPGTGIGLNFAYKLAKHIRGSLKAENLPTDKGVKFTLELPVSETAFEIDDFVVEYSYKEELTNSEDYFEGEDSVKEHTILVVDDDIDIANYITMLLSPYYNVICAYNTESANEYLLSDAMPDIVLSDIIMPNEDGISFCKAIKNNMLTCHIPVILVTAKIGVSNEVEGLESGADAYVTKPFDPMYMLALIKSIIKNRELVKGELVKSTEIGEVDNHLLSSQDKDFMSKLYRIMERELSNAELNIQEVSNELCVSRTKLFYKTKSLTGMSPVYLFRTYRLNMAAKMLKESGDSISEIAFKVGFNSPSYFTRAFKAQFGYLPKEVKRDVPFPTEIAEKIKK